MALLRVSMRDLVSQRYVIHNATSLAALLVRCLSSEVIPVAFNPMYLHSIASLSAILHKLLDKSNVFISPDAFNFLTVEMLYPRPPHPTAARQCGCRSDRS